MPLLWLSLAFLSGILLATQISLPVSLWLVLGGLGIAAGWLAGRLPAIREDERKAKIVRWIAPVLLVLALGAARYRAAQPDFTDPGLIAGYNDRGTISQVEGLLVEPPDVRDTYTNLLLDVERIQPDEHTPAQSAHGRVLVRVPPNGDWRYGDRLRVQGELVTPPVSEDFSYKDFLYRRHVYSLVRSPEVESLQHGQGNSILAAIYAFKDQALATVFKLYPDPEASLLAGILLGVEGGIPAPVAQAFRDTGTAHIIAISGFNISILAALFSKIFTHLLGRWRGAAVAAIVIAVYTLLVGAGASVVRAALMGGLGLLARQVGRRQYGLNSLAITAALMAVQDPYVPWDVSFQLSFAATLGLILYGSPSLEAAVAVAGRFLPPANARRMAGLVADYFLLTLAAQLTALPVTIYHFQRLSWSSLIANPLVLPVQPAVMVIGGLGVLLGMLFLPLGQAVAYLAWPFVVYTIRMAEWLGRIPGGSIPLGETSLGWVLLFYALLFGATFALPRLKVEGWRGLLGKLQPSLILFGLLVANVLVWRAVITAPDGRLHVTLLNASSASLSGEAVLIRTPGGRSILVGGGPSASALSEGLGRRLPLGQRRLDMLVVANPAEDQVAALVRTVERFPPEQVLWAGPTNASAQARALGAELDRLGIEPLPVASGQVLDLGQGVRLNVLEANARGAVLLLEWGSFRLLLPMGVDKGSLKGLNLSPVTALLLAEGGYAPLNPPEWIERLRPQVVLLSVSPGDRRGLPSPETLEAVKGYTLFRTDRNGWIDITTDGEQIWVEVERR